MTYEQKQRLNESFPTNHLHMIRTLFHRRLLRIPSQQSHAIFFDRGIRKWEAERISSLLYTLEIPWTIILSVFTRVGWGKEIKAIYDRV
jgi:hypothetical protein